MKTPLPVTVVILAFNEEANLPACLESVSDWSQEIWVVDSGSKDKTQRLATGFGARIVEHSFESHAKQWDWALRHLPITAEWVLGLDADQRLSPELREEVISLFSEEKEELAGIDGIYLKRKQIFRGQWIRHGGYYPKYLLKLFRKDKVQVDIHDLIDHHFYISGKTLKLSENLVEENLKESDLKFWIEKHRRYARLHAAQELRQRRNGKRPISPSFFGTPDQLTLRLKTVWYRLPLFVRPFLYFFYRYFIRLGFLDGTEGLVFHFLHGFWYRMLIDIHLNKLRSQM